MAQYMELKEKWMIFSLQEYYLVGQEFLLPITVGADRDWCLTSSFCYYHFLPHRSWPHNFPLSSNRRTEPDRQSKSTSRVQLTFSGNLSQFLKVLSKPTVWEKVHKYRENQFKLTHNSYPQPELKPSPSRLNFKGALFDLGPSNPLKWTFFVGNFFLLKYKKFNGYSLRPEQSIGNITKWSSSLRFSNNDLCYRSFTSSVQQTTYNTRISKSTEH